MNIAFREFVIYILLVIGVHFQAGIKSSNLIIANESNAASVFCLFDRSERGNIRGLDTQPVGTKYMVVDIGGVNFSLTDDQIKINTCKFGKSHFPKARGVTVIVLEDVIIIWGHVSQSAENQNLLTPKMY